MFTIALLLVVSSATFILSLDMCSDSLNFLVGLSLLSAMITLFWVKPMTRDGLIEEDQLVSDREILLSDTILKHVWIPSSENTYRRTAMTPR